MTQDFIKAFNEANEINKQSHAGGFKAALRQKFQLFRKKEDGSVIIFGLYMFICMMIISGTAISFMRAEERRTRIQYTTDRALLASAAMSQTLDAQDIFDDYFAKAGMKGLAPTATVIDGLNFRRVSAKYAPGNEPTLDTFFISKEFRELLKTHPNDDAGGIDKLKTVASGVAIDGVERVEISLVLDVSGSMGWGSQSGNSKLYDLQEAAKEFVDTLMLNQPEDDTYSISVVPFSTQVNAGENLLSKYNASAEHDYSHCVDFEAADFEATSLSTLDELQRTGHFNPWDGGYTDKPIHWKSRPCPPIAERAILPFSGDIAELKDYIDGFEAAGNTSADIGIKWGAALLDPSAQSVVTSLIADGDIAAKFSGRPYAYGEENIMKVIVVMSDGKNTSQYYQEPFVSGGMADPADNMSNVWHKVNSSGNDRYAIYNADRNKYFRTYTESTNGYWSNSPRSGMEQLSYVELYNHASVRYIAKYLMDPADYSYNFWRYDTYHYVNSSVKDVRMDSICSAAKDRNVIIFAIGFEVTDSNATKLSNCASSAGHFFRVEGVEISVAFASIAAQLHRLRLEM